MHAAASLWPHHSARVAPASSSPRQGVAIAATQEVEEVEEEEERGDLPSQPSTIRSNGNMEGSPGLSTGGLPPIGPQGAWALIPPKPHTLSLIARLCGGGFMAAVLVP